MPSFIVTADDFGLHEQIDRGIFTCCDKGLISSVSVATVGARFADDISGLLGYRSIGLGIHLCLTDERPCSPRKEIASLVQGDRFPGLPALARRLAAGQVRPEEVYTEWKRQIETGLAAGAEPDHLDTHQHVQLFPALFAVLIHLAEEYHIPAIRYLGGACPPRAYTPPNVLKRILSLRIARMYRELPAREIVHPDAVRGFYRQGTLSGTALDRFLREAAPDDCTEIICHPGTGHARSAARYAAWGYDWGGECAALEALPGIICHVPEARLTTFARLAAERTLCRGTAPRKPSSLSVIIPAHNESQNIRKTVKIASRFLATHAIPHEILVVDDRSADDTARQAGELLGADKGRVLTRTERQGYGAVLRTGFRASACDWILYFDADYPAHINNALEAFKHIGTHDIIIGARVNPFRDGALRSVYRIGYIALVKLLFRVSVSDVNFAFKLFRKDVVDTLALSAQGSFIDAELLIKAHQAGYSIREVPMIALGRTFGRSRLMTFSNVFSLVTELARFRSEAFAGKGLPARERRTAQGLSRRENNTAN